MDWNRRTLVTDDVSIIMTTGVHTENGFEGKVIESEYKVLINYSKNSWNKSKFHIMTINQANYGKIELDVVNVPESTKKAIEVTQTQHILGIKGELPIRQWYEMETLPALIGQLQRLYDENK